MREYAAFAARAHSETSVLGRLQRGIANWRRRRKLRQLLDLDDYLLADIGVTRTEVMSAMRLAWYVDHSRAGAAERAVVAARRSLPLSVLR